MLRSACVALFSITIAQPAWADIELEDNMPVEQWSNYQKREANSVPPLDPEQVCLNAKQPATKQ